MFRSKGTLCNLCNLCNLFRMFWFIYHFDLLKIYHQVTNFSQILLKFPVQSLFRTHFSCLALMPNFDTLLTFRKGFEKKRNKTFFFKHIVLLRKSQDASTASFQRSLSVLYLLYRCQDLADKLPEKTSVLLKLAYKKPCVAFVAMFLYTKTHIF